MGSGGESKDDFWKMVHISTDILPKNKPRYLMGVGFGVDLVVCSALGCDMYDCVFPRYYNNFIIPMNYFDYYCYFCLSLLYFILAELP